MKQRVQSHVHTCACVLELAFAIILVASVLISGTIFVVQTFTTAGFFYQANALTHMAKGIFNLVIAIEFIKMLVRHTPESVIEVLLFATARQIVIGHGTPLESLTGILCVALLFITRKYFFCALDSHEMESLPKFSFGLTKLGQALRADSLQAEADG